uniref:Uncharacterized protein n=1 Tax=Siphoviridae sp. ctuvC1 TaxID=2826507 RepID=A0A8S5LZV4_9CAUD|nr:MAG TPA: hypothetical protein [Siphoviridae sp. ctuvC1]
MLSSAGLKPSERRRRRTQRQMCGTSHELTQGDL